MTAATTGRARRLGTAVRLGDYAPGSAAWDVARATRVGGSEVAALLGLSPWESWFSLWHRKRGLLGPVDDTEHMWWGRNIEPVLAERFALDHPEWNVARTGTWVHRDRDYQLSSPDRLLVRPGGGAWELLEIKHPHDPFGEIAEADGTLTALWGETGTDQVPIYYRCQALWQMDTFGVERCRFAVYFGGGDYREYLVRYDAEQAAVLRERAELFLAAVAADEQPNVDEHSATLQALQSLHPDIADVDVEIPDELAAAYLASLDAQDTAKDEHALQRARVAALVGDGRRAINGLNAKNKPRAIATRIPGRNGGAPYLRANPRPKPKKEIA
ncbi:putative endonuclease [Microcystis phage Mwe-JY05]